MPPRWPRSSPPPERAVGTHDAGRHTPAVAPAPGCDDGGVAQRPTLVYDADCAFCTRSAQVARRWVDRQGRYDVRPWQELDLAALGLTAEQCDEAAQFVRADGAIRSGHEAIAAALMHGAPAWRPLGHVLLAPGVRALAARTYAWVAQHRHQLPGGTAQCARPGPGDDRTVGDAPRAPGLRQRPGPL